MNTRLVNTAADVILAALTQNRTAAGIALALESACMLQSPETAAEAAKLRDRVDEVERAYTFDTAALKRRVAELEQLLAAKDRPADEDPIAFSLTVEASCGRALATGKPCPDHAHDEDVTPQVRKLRNLLAGQRAAVEDPHDSPLAHKYELGRDLPEVRP